MNKSIVFKVFVLITLLTGIAIPKLIYQDAENVPQKDIKVAKQEAHEVLEHPLDFLQIMNILFQNHNIFLFSIYRKTSPSQNYHRS